MAKCYIAAPWFTDEQAAILTNIRRILAETGVDYFSPKDENLWVPGIDPLAVLIGNCIPLKSAKFVVAVTDGKDVGTMWECGYAYANKVPILYVWLGRQPGQKFNIMLAASGEVVHNYDALRTQLNAFQVMGHFIKADKMDGDYE